MPCFNICLNKDLNKDLNKVHVLLLVDLSFQLHLLYIHPPISFILLFNVFIKDRSSPTSEFRVTNWNINTGASFLCIFSILRGKKISELIFELFLGRSNEVSFFVVAV